MEANVSYNDFKGTASADISDGLAIHCRAVTNLEKIGEYFKIDPARFKTIGISIEGTDDFDLSLICIDLLKSKPEKEHIVIISIDNTEEKISLKSIFKRLNVVLYSNYDNKYSKLNHDEVISINNCLNSDEK